jgi:hypothetical protein
MDKLEDDRTAQCGEETAGSNQVRKSPPLRLDKQVIRTLAGTDLKVAAGAYCGGSVPFSIHIGCDDTH